MSDPDPPPDVPRDSPIVDVEEFDGDEDPFVRLAALPEIPEDNIQLEKIPRRLWSETLAPLHRQQAMWVARQVPDEQLRDLAITIVVELDLAASARAIEREKTRVRARRIAAPLPAPGADHAILRPSVQINIRLRRDDHARLKEAADAVGLKPTPLARALVLNGAARILEERAGSRPDQPVRGRTPGYP